MTASSKQNPVFEQKDKVFLNLVSKKGPKQGRADKEIPTCLLRIFEKIERGHLLITTPRQNQISFGDPNACLRAHWIIRQPECFREMLCRGSLGLGESYMKGWWDEEEDRVTDLLSIILSNNLQDSVKRNIGLAIRLAYHRLLNSPYLLANSRRCIKKHYDLSNRLFELFLDQSLSYTCGYKLNPSDTIEDMQKQKCQLICDKLGLDRGGRLLDVGCGWGGFLIYAAQKYKNIQGLGITISSEQYAAAKKRVQAAGLSRQIEIELCDYRKIFGEFDFVTSVGMFEHVGKLNHGQFMRQMYALLKDDGIGLLHTIGTTVPPSMPSDAWTTTYIFPGIRLTRLEEIVSQMRQSKLLVGHIENLKPHYGETLREWKEIFDQNRSKIQLLDKNFDHTFMRMWNYYLQSTEACFRHGATQVYQVLFCKGPEWKFPLPYEKVE